MEYYVYGHVYDSPKDVIIDILCVLRVFDIWFVANVEPLKETMDPSRTFGFSDCRK